MIFTPALADHLFVFLGLGLILPLGGWWAYRKFLERHALIGDAALVGEYRLTALWQIGMAAAVIAVWLAAARPLDGLWRYHAPMLEAEGLAGGLVAGATIALVARPLLAWRSAKFAATLRKAFGKLEAFLPKTPEQLVWSLIISVGAGVSEELAYRGFLQPYLETWFSPWVALGIGSVIFGLAHIYQGVTGTLLTTVLGAVLGAAYLITGSLVLPIILHAVIDISAMLTAYVVLRRPDAGANAAASR